MASEPQTDTFQSFLHFLSTSWSWLLGLGGGFVWLIRLNVRVDNLEKATNNLSDIPVRLAKLETKVDMMYQTILDIQKDIKKG
jgi:hypothetical protein